MRTAIYGLFDEHDVCLYVGRTQNPDRRKASHNHTKIGRKYPRFRFKILEWVESQPFLAEGKHIQKYKSLGQSEFNTLTNHSSCSITIKEARDLIFSLMTAPPIVASFILRASDRSLVLRTASILRAAKMINFKVASNRRSNGEYVLYKAP